MTATSHRQAILFPNGFMTAFLLNMLWINASEVFRYFVFVMPMVRDTLSVTPDVAPMTVPIFLIWGVWDTILVFVVSSYSWIIVERLGPSFKTILMAGTLIWLSIFVIFWFALWNMNLTTIEVIATALPLAWLEMVVAVWIVQTVMVRQK